MSKENSSTDFIPYNRSEAIALFDAGLLPNSSTPLFGIEYEGILALPQAGYNAPFYDLSQARGLVERFNIAASVAENWPTQVEIFKHLASTLGWREDIDKESPHHDPIIAGITPDREGFTEAFTVEFGRAIEYAGKPHHNIHTMVQETQYNLAAALTVLADKGVALLDFGYHPTQNPLVQKPARRPRFEMMHKQYCNNANSTFMNGMASQVTVGLVEDVAPQQIELLTYLSVVLAGASWNSPFVEGKPASNGLLSQRAANYEKGFPNSMFGPLYMALNEGFSSAAYVDAVMQCSMLIKTGKNGGYISAVGHYPADYMAGGKYHDPRGEYGEFSMADFANQLKAARPESRITPGRAEQRADDSNIKLGLSLAAINYLLTSNQAAMEEALAVFRNAGLNDSNNLADFRKKIAAQGLKAEDHQGKNLKNYLVQMLAITEIVMDQRGLQEHGYLEPLRTVIDSGKTPAEEKLDLFHLHEGNIIKVITEHSLKASDLVFPEIVGNDRYVEQAVATHHNNLSKTRQLKL
ncbi:MAG: glutamate-cysteine ligase family protein [Alphaproteobacteria bacterium]